MPTFKDINTFVQKTPDGTEKIQVSATQYVTLQQIANLASVSDADIMGKKLVGFTRAPWAKSYPETDDIAANSTLLSAIKAIISSLNPIISGFTFRVASHSDMETGAILQMYSSSNDEVGNIIWNAAKDTWGFSRSLIEDQDQADAAIEGVGSIASTFSFSCSPWTVINGTSLTAGLSIAPNTIFNGVPGSYFTSESYNLIIGSPFMYAQEVSCMIILDEPINSQQLDIEGFIFNKLSRTYGSGPIYWVNPGDIISEDSSERGYVLIQRLVNNIYITVGNLKNYSY